MSYPTMCPHSILLPARENRNTSEKKDVSIPLMVKAYNQHMGGVDLADQMKGTYAIDLRSRYRNYLRLFFDVLDTAVVNSYVIYNELHVADGKKLEHLEFRQQLVYSLVGSFSSRKRSHPCGNIRKRPWQPDITDAKHMPVCNDRRKRCKHCSVVQIGNRTSISCKTCGVYLCLQNGRNCFQDYHS